MSTEIQTVGTAIIFQSIIRYAAFIAIAWMALSYLDGWITAYLST